MPKKIAHFHCTGIPVRLRVKVVPGCGATFEEFPGPNVQCPHCGSMWVRWLDYINFKDPEKKDNGNQ